MVKRKEVKVATEVPTFQVPEQTMLALVKDFDFQISKVPVAPNRKEFTGSGRRRRH